MAPYRQAELLCPHCRVTIGDNALCPKCEGAWVSESSLRERMDAVTVDNTHVPDFDGFFKTGVQKYECPTCHGPLDVVRIDDIEVERCYAAHGIWFDATELQAVLHRASKGREVGAPSGTVVVTPTLAEAVVDAALEFLFPTNTFTW